jgi:hypothetical protein
MTGLSRLDRRVLEATDRFRKRSEADVALLAEAAPELVPFALRRPGSGFRPGRPEPVVEVSACARLSGERLALSCSSTALRCSSVIAPNRSRAPVALCRSSPASDDIAALRPRLGPQRDPAGALRLPDHHVPLGPRVGREHYLEEAVSAVDQRVGGHVAQGQEWRREPRPVG